MGRRALNSTLAPYRMAPRGPRSVPADSGRACAEGFVSHFPYDTSCVAMKVDIFCVMSTGYATARGCLLRKGNVARLSVPIDSIRPRKGDFVYCDGHGPPLLNLFLCPARAKVVLSYLYTLESYAGSSISILRRDLDRVVGSVASPDPRVTPLFGVAPRTIAPSDHGAQSTVSRDGARVVPIFPGSDCG